MNAASRNHDASTEMGIPPIDPILNVLPNIASSGFRAYPRPGVRRGPGAERSLRSARPRGIDRVAAGGPEDDSIVPFHSPNACSMMLDVMNALRTCLDELRSEPLRPLTDEQLEERLTDLARTRRVVEAESARTVGEIERRGSFGVDGHLSVTSFVESRLGVGWSEAAREVRMARALEHMPAAREALGLGEVSSSAIGALAAAREANPEAFSEAEEDLVEVARTMPARGLRLAVERWKVRVEPRAAERED